MEVGRGPVHCPMRPTREMDIGFLSQELRCFAPIMALGASERGVSRPGGAAAMRGPWGTRVMAPWGPRGGRPCSGSQARVPRPRPQGGPCSPRVLAEAYGAPGKCRFPTSSPPGPAPVRPASCSPSWAPCVPPSCWPRLGPRAGAHSQARHQPMVGPGCSGWGGGVPRAGQRAGGRAKAPSRGNAGSPATRLGEPSRGLGGRQPSPLSRGHWAAGCLG